MGAIAEFGQRVEAARDTLRQIEQQHSKYNEDLAGLLKEVAECANLKRVEMIESRSQYEHIMDEYSQLKELLHSPVLTSGSSLHGSLGDIVRDLDAEVVDLRSASASNVTLVDQATAQDENIAETDPDRVRLGLHRALRKRRSQGGKAEK